MGVDKGGAHVFRRFRATWLRKEKTPEDLIRLWLGHGGTTVTDLYVNIENEKAWRKKEVERVGVGFTLPTSVVPNVPKLEQTNSVQIAAYLIVRAGIKLVGASGFEPPTSWSRTR
jgi:hypothetical protein